MSFISVAQCDTVEINPANYSVLSISSENGNNKGNLLFDGDNNTRWRTKGANNHEIVVDLGKTETVTGMSYRTRWTGSGKIASYEIYGATIQGQWGLGEKYGDGDYSQSNNSDTVYFGAVNARYIKLKCTSSLNDLQLSELRFFKDTCSASGKKNQTISFPSIEKQETNASPIQLAATTNGPGVINYTVESGPATVSGSTITLTKQAGTVVVKASISSSTTHYASSRIISFPVIDLATYNPIVTTRLTEDFPIELADTTQFYMIYVTADIPEKKFLSISEVNVDIEGETIKAQQINNEGFFIAWNPHEFRTYKIDITATGSNGKTTTITKNIEVKQGSSTQTVTSMKDAVIWYGRENSRDYYGTYSLPQFTGVYNKIVAKLEVECPDNNCDDWDRWAHFDIKTPDGDWMQIIRYMTPYNVGCTHEIDLTEYASVLQGELDFHVFIDTWGTGGWQLTLDFEYTAGTPKYPYSTVTEIWDGRYDFGNMANLQPVPDKSVYLPKGTEEAEIIFSTSGHGWGQDNTGNAAEFYHAKHDIMVDDTKEFTQDLWNECNPNPDKCYNQQGTWMHNRAGWCPGAIAPPHKFNITKFKDQTSMKLGYKFQDNYRDFCHPNNPSCVSGTTCSNCNAGYNPHYNVDVATVYYGNTPMAFGYDGGVVREFETGVETINMTKSFELYPNPTNATFSVQTDRFSKNITGALYSIDGTQYKRYYFESIETLESFEFDISDIESGVYFLELTEGEQSSHQRIVKQ